MKKISFAVEYGVRIRRFNRDHAIMAGLRSAWELWVLYAAGDSKYEPSSVLCIAFVLP